MYQEYRLCEGWRASSPTPWARAWCRGSCWSRTGAPSPPAGQSTILIYSTSSGTPGNDCWTHRGRWLTHHCSSWEVWAHRQLGPWLQLPDWFGWSIGAVDRYAFRRNWLICLSYTRCWLICTQKWLIDLFHNRITWLICVQKELIIPGSTT